MILGGKAYKNLRRKGGEKYREVYLRWVAKPIEKIDRNHEITDLARIQNHEILEKSRNS